MPITPRFEITQTLSHLTVEISVPSTRVSSDSIEVLLEDERVLHFFSAPYLLKLAFENNFQENAHEECAKYDPSKATITLTLAKQEAVEWPRLDLTARLLQPKPVNSRWLREVLQEEETDAAGDDDNHNNNEDHDNDLSATENDTDTTDLLRPITMGDGYGFANMFQNIFVDFCRAGLAQEMLQLDNPEGSSRQDRQTQRREKEEEDFDADRYLGDFEVDVEDDYLFSMAMSFEPHWRGSDSLSRTMQQLEVTSEASSPVKESFFNSDEQLLLATLPYPLLPKIDDDVKKSSLYCGLLDLLFAHVYDHLMTQGDPTVESAWTISTLSYSLSWFDSLDKVDQVVLSSLRRALIYPFIRNLDFGKYIWKQVSEIVLDQRSVIRCVLQMRNTLEKSESYYLGNKLYIDPYLAWLQQVQTFPSEQLSKEILATIQLSNLNEILDLNLLEYEAMLLDEEGEEEQDDKEESGSEGDSDSDSDDDSESEDESDSDESVGEAPEKADEKTAALASTALLDAELGRTSMLKIIEPDNAPIVPESLSTSVDQTPPKKPLIQEL